MLHDCEGEAYVTRQFAKAIITLDWALCEELRPYVCWVTAGVLDLLFLIQLAVAQLTIASTTAISIARATNWSNTASFAQHSRVKLVLGL